MLGGAGLPFPRPVLRAFFFKEQDRETGVRDGPPMHDPGRRFYRLRVRTPDGIRQVEIDEAGKLLRNFPL
jgi:hypothetical protein